MLTTVTIHADTSELVEYLDALNAELDRSPELRERALDFINSPAELVVVEGGSAFGASGALFFKPSQLLLDLLMAVRTGNFDDLAVKYAHKPLPPNVIRGEIVAARVKISDLAGELGLSTAAIHQVINGSRRNHKIRAAIAKAIGKTVAEIWPDTNQEAA